MERGEVSAKEGDVSSPADETLSFDDETLRAIAEVYKNEGNDEYKKKDFNNAVYFYTEGIKANCRDKELNAKLHSNRAAAYFNLGNYIAALADAKAATDLQPSLLKAFVRGASACVHLNQFDQAITWCEKGLAIDSTNQELAELRSRSVNERKKLQGSHEVKKTTRLKERDWKNCEGHVPERIKQDIICNEHRLEIAKQVGDKAVECTAYGDLGQAYYRLRDFKRTIDCFERYLTFERQYKDKSVESVAYNKLGNAHLSLGNYKSAMDYHEGHLKISKELGNRSGEANAYGNIGNAHQSMGHFKTAIDYHKRKLKISRELGDRSGEGIAYGNLGNAYHSLGDFKTAIDSYKCHLQISKELGDNYGEGAAYGNLGIAYLSLGDFKAAIEFHECKLEISKQMGDVWGEGKAYGNLGNAYHSLGDFKTAIDYHERHLRISKDLGDRPGQRRAYCNLGSSHGRLGDFKTAIDYHVRDLNISKELGDRSAEGAAYANLGNAHGNIGNFKTAICYNEHGLKIAKQLGDKLGQGIGCANLGVSFESLGQPHEALRYYQCSVTLLNNIRDSLKRNDDWKISLRDQYQTTYARLWRLLLAEGRVMEALFSAEQGRAQGLKDLMAANYSLETNYVESDKEDGNLHKLLSNLSTNTIFIAFGKRELVFWVCQKGKFVELRRKELDSLDEINTLVQHLRQEIGSRGNMSCEDRSLDLARRKRLVDIRSPHDHRRTNISTVQKDASAILYEAIVSPILDLFIGRELIFVPEGALGLAPFAALKDPSSKYLCESFRIRVIPSLTCLKVIADCPDDYHCKSGVLLVGDPWVQDMAELQPLPFARREVEMIGRMLGCIPLTGRQATKGDVLRRISSVALVHIAAHGSMETGEIALAPNTGEEDFILTMKDVLCAQIRARLVVLSCCHSARGEIKAEGVVGIARAFLGAGARSVLVSLWAIDDQATLEFMKHFYQHLVRGRSASEALNLAMNCMRESEEFREVKHWAPFVLIGDDVKLDFGGDE